MPSRGFSAAATGASTVAKKSLFDDDSNSEDDHDEGGVPLDSQTGLKINQEYARRFEHNKRREEMHRLEEKLGKNRSRGGAGGDDDESESSENETEDEDGFLVTEDLDAEISATLRAIKNKDPRIYDKSATFYKPFDPDAEPTKGTKEKTMSLRDYHRQRYLNGDTGADAAEDEATGNPKTYTEEQEDLKHSILSEINATAEADPEDWTDDDDFIKRKEPAEQQPEQDGVHPSRAKQVKQVKLTELDVTNADKDPETFLDKFMASKAWAMEEGSRWQAFESDDEDGDDGAEEFEHAYNMRFEDPATSNEVLKSYSRDLAANRSVRREEAKGRKRQRMLEKEQTDAKKQERDDDRARLRRMKIEDAQEKLLRIKRAAGMSGKSLTDEDWVRFLDDAWEDDKWEEEMTRRFGEEYYAASDNLSDGEDEDGVGEEEEEIGSKKHKTKKPKWDDDIDIKDLIPEFDEDSKPEFTLTDSEGEQNEDGNDDEDEEDKAERPAKKRKTTKDIKKERQASRHQARRELAQIEALVDSKMELDNPRALAASGSSSKAPAPTFRYRETSPTSFGLTARDILLAPSDAVLNDFVGIKKLATFRDPEKKRKDKKKLGKKARLRQWRRETFGADFEQTGPTYGFGERGGRRSSRVKSQSRSQGARPQDGESREAKEADGFDPADDVNMVDGERKKKRKRSKGKKAAASA